MLDWEFQWEGCCLVSEKREIPSDAGCLESQLSPHTRGDACLRIRTGGWNGLIKPENHLPQNWLYLLISYVIISFQQLSHLKSCFLVLAVKIIQTESVQSIA